jgi:ketosteroid isomerase-like protein
LPALAPFVGAERIVWGSDYPHHDATFPGAVEALRHTIAPCPTATQAKVLGLNARGIYRLPTRQAGPAGIMSDYFAAVTAHDADLLRTLFAPDATFDVDGEIRSGHEQILAYYTERTFTFDDFRPAPQPLHVEGSTVTVDIDVHIGGAESRVRDVFELEDGRISSLCVRGFADALEAGSDAG